MPDRPARWSRRLPGLLTIQRYRQAWLARDLAAGLALTAVLVPVGIAYAVASGLPAICGLYATIAALLAYAVFGPSRVLVLGPDSSLAPLVLAVVLPLAAGDAARAMAIAAAMALVSGAICIAAGLARLGFVTELLSKPIRYGYMNGIAIAVMASQLPALFGIPVSGDDLGERALRFVVGVAAGRTEAASLAIGAATLVSLLLLRRRRGVPGVLVAVVAATAVVAFFDLDRDAGVDVLGRLPEGLPAFALPWLDAGDLGAVVVGGLAVALVSFADTSVLSRAYAGRSGGPVDTDQEMVALGAANVAAGFFQGLPVSASASRTPVAEAAGARTQLAGVIGAVAVGVLLLAAPGLLRHLPTPALAAVVIASALALVEVADLRRIRRIQPWEFWLSIGCLLGVLLLGAVAGIGLAIGIAVVEFVWGAWRPHSAVLGRVDGIAGFHDIARHPGAAREPGLVLFRWDAPLFFANAELFRERIGAAIAAAPTPVRRVVVGAEPVTRIDITAADMLDELDRALAAAGIELCFAEVKDPVRDTFRRFGLDDRLGAARFHATIDEAVAAHVAESAARRR